MGASVQPKIEPIVCNNFIKCPFFFLLSEEVTPITEVPKAPSTADSSDNNTTSSGSSVPDKEDIVNKNAKNNNSDTDEGVVLVMEDRLEPPKVETI